MVSRRKFAILTLSFRRPILQRAVSQVRQTGQKERRIGARAPVRVEAGELTEGRDAFPAAVDAVVEGAGEVKEQQEKK